MTRNEVLYGKNVDPYRLALVSVHPDGPVHDQLRYLVDPFGGVEFTDLAVDSVRFDWRELWSRGGPPLTSVVACRRPVALQAAHDQRKGPWDQ